MSTFDALKQVEARISSLHEQYQKIERAKDDLISSTADDAANVRREIQQLRALKPQIDDLVRTGEELEKQSSTAVAAVNDEVSKIESDNDDKLSDISVYATDWPSEIDDVIADLEESLREGEFDKSSSRAYVRRRARSADAKAIASLKKIVASYLRAKA